MGRKKQQWTAEMKALWVKDKGLNPSMKGVALSSTQQYYWHASCGLHYRLVQPNTVKKAVQQGGT
jgi:hypothetical protein